MQLAGPVGHPPGYWSTHRERVRRRDMILRYDMHSKTHQAQRHEMAEFKPYDSAENLITSGSFQPPDTLNSGASHDPNFPC